MRRSWSLLCVALLLLWIITTQLNHYLSGFHAHLFLGALYFTFTALRFPTRSGLLLTAAAGLLCDATTPVPLGTHLLLFSLAHAIICHLRHRLPAEHGASQLIVALIANAALYLVLTLELIVRQPVIAQLWPRLLWDLFLSEMVMVLIGPWFLALQDKITAPNRFALRESL